ncbi:hypothetical protein ACQV5M_17640 [Leptospira sp. SA-E8]|uniref:hypothetical protein n=1 Tax=Leptospira sp. SA-E8 TaxID=3422259 RepID=UPI003EB6D9FB
MSKLNFTKQPDLISPANQKHKANLLNDEEIKAIIIAVESAFMKLKNLYDKVTPIFDEYGFKAPSAGVIARDLSEKIETSIIQHCKTFNKGLKNADLSRSGERWEVKICKKSGLAINQSAIISGENYIVVNYKDTSTVSKIFVLWAAQDHFFSERKRNANIRYLLMSQAIGHIQEIYTTK